MTWSLPSLAYLVSAICFILAIRGLASPETARTGNVIGMIGMAIAIGATLLLPQVATFALVLGGIAIGGAIGTFVALKVKITQLPQLVAIFNSLVGLAAVLISGAALHSPTVYGIPTIGGQLPTGTLIEMMASTAIGAVTFTGSVLAFAKLQGLVTGTPIVFTGQRAVNGLAGMIVIFCAIAFVGWGGEGLFWALAIVAFACGALVVMPIGGADMPVVISVLNSLSGWASCGVGFTLKSPLMIVTGALVGASGAILSYIMCRGMNRSLVSVLLGGFGGEKAATAVPAQGLGPVKAGNADDAAFILEGAGSVVIVPGYGMAVAQAQHALREMADLLGAAGVKVRYAIHPVAGRMPGHMNVLLAEANVPYDQVVEMDDINRDFPTTDVAFVIGANDITNPAARTDASSPIYGMPVLEVDRARMVMFVKRSMATGYAGVDNSLFVNENTMMLFGDAKQMCEDIIKALR
jgi:H+-translocating NAD(P) transhydrogenase subunit beta